MSSPAENAATVPDKQLRTKLVAALNGYTVDADTGWAIIKRFDALLAQAEAPKDYDAIREMAEDERDAAVRERDQVREALRQAGTSLDAILIGWRESLPRDVVQGLTALRDRIARAALTGEGTE